VNRKRKPVFRRTQGAALKRLSRKGWRRPDGKHNKLRDKKKGKGEAPSIGYGAKRSERFLHPSGLEEVLVSSTRDVASLDPGRQAARISAGVGRRKKELLIEELRKRKVKVLNPLR